LVFFIGILFLLLRGWGNVFSTKTIRMHSAKKDEVASLICMQGNRNTYPLGRLKDTQRRALLSFIMFIDGNGWK